MVQRVISFLVLGALVAAGACISLIKGFGSFSLAVLGGAACYALIILSEWGASRGSIFIRDKIELKQRKPLDESRVLESLGAAGRKNDNLFVTKGLAVDVEDLFNVMKIESAVAGNNSIGGMEDSLSLPLFKLLEGMKVCISGKFIGGGLSKEMIAARILYGKWISGENCKVSKNVDGILRANLTSFADRCIGAGDLKTIAVFDAEEEFRFWSVLEGFSKDSAMLLLRASSGDLEVLRCW
ncbi:MAG TPA: hypothetical protein VL944_01485 [Candidatus Acidoferrum sp.]|nr:hypothetical protein [Candidatus Acidoferrum sp.]